MAARTLNILIDPNTEERITIQMYGILNQRWQNMMSKSIEALGKGKPIFGRDYSKYEIGMYKDYFKIIIYLENEDELHIEIPGYELFPKEMLIEFSEKGYAIPDDITAEQEFESEKVIIRKIGNTYRI